ncbi:MAG TPA: GIY-YIG nuclease family protein [Methanocorpusculum sp.]|nr:GIY-YIG nuclease family protein [Methanocorpusculum sp.]
MKKGIYCLLVKNSKEQSICVGALGTITFPAGYYIYVGSALGSGGLSRVSRHIRFFREHYRKPKWHIDYLTMNAVLEKTFCAETEERLECVLSAAVGGDCVPRFGCSDCDCASHLYYRKENPEEEIRYAFEKLRLTAAEHQVS